MFALFSDENFDRNVVLELRRLGHDVLTAHEAGRVGSDMRTLSEHRRLETGLSAGAMRAGGAFHVPYQTVHFRLVGRRDTPVSPAAGQKCPAHQFGIERLLRISVHADGRRYSNARRTS